MTFYMVFFPEFVMMWAVGQWYGARLVIRNMNNAVEGVSFHSSAFSKLSISMERF